MKWGGQNFSPTLFNLAKAESTQSNGVDSVNPKKKNQTSNFMIKIPSLNFQNSKAQNFRFQIKNF